MKIKPTVGAPLLALFIYILLLVSRMIDFSALEGADNVYLAVVVLQLVVFAVPALIYGKLKGEGYAKKLRLALPRPEAMICVAIASVLLISGEMLLRIALSRFLPVSDGFSLYGAYAATGADGSLNALYIIFAFALIPAVCEEFVFRSIMIAEYESCGVFTAVIASSLLFSAMHFDLVRAPIYLFSGIVLAMTLYVTRSTLAVVIVHFIYNIFGLFGQKYISAFYETTGSEELFVFLLAVIFILFLVLFFGEAGRIYETYSKKNKDAPYFIPKNEKRGKLVEALLSPLFLSCILLFVVVAVGLD